MVPSNLNEHDLVGLRGIFYFAYQPRSADAPMEKPDPMISCITEARGQKLKNSEKSSLIRV